MIVLKQETWDLAVIEKLALDGKPVTPEQIAFVFRTLHKLGQHVEHLQGALKFYAVEDNYAKTAAFDEDDRVDYMPSPRWTTMKLSLVSFLARSACGGAPFTLNELSTDRPDADPGLEASAGDDAGPEAAEDAGQDAQEADPGDAAPDTKQDQDAAPDAQEPDSGAQDSGHKPDSGSSQPDSGSGSGDAGLACPGDLACNPAGRV